MCSEAEARGILADHADTLIGIIVDGWQAHLDEGERRSDRTRANIVWDKMVELADERLVGLPEVERVEVWDSPIYVFSERLAVRFKKHSRDLNTRNITTGHQRAILAQEPLPGLPETARVTCGYVLDDASAGVEKCVVVKRVGGRREWGIDLHELAAGQLEPETPSLPLDDSPAGRLPTIISPETDDVDEAEDNSK